MNNISFFNLFSTENANKTETFHVTLFFDDSKRFSAQTGSNNQHYKATVPTTLCRSTLTATACRPTTFQQKEQDDQCLTVADDAYWGGHRQCQSEQVPCWPCLHWAGRHPYNNLVLWGPAMPEDIDYVTASGQLIPHIQLPLARLRAALRQVGIYKELVLLVIYKP